jgi:hypothetical protein
MRSNDPITAASIQTFGGNAGLVPSAALRRTAQIINTIILANSTLPLFQAGEAFYIIACNSSVEIRPANGTFNSYYTGTGVRVDSQNAFDQLEVRNSHDFPVTISLWVGFGNYIDNRSILISNLFYRVGFPLNPVASANVSLDMLDKSGTAIVDINGKTWLALNRIQVLMTNFDMINSIPFLDMAGAVGAIFSCLPNTSAVFELDGDYLITLGGTPLNCIIAEIYNCIEPTLGP